MIGQRRMSVASAKANALAAFAAGVPSAGLCKPYKIL